MTRLQVHVSSDGLRREIRSNGKLPEVFFEITPRNGAPAPEFDTADFALIAMLPLAMRDMTDLHAEFEVDALLLDGLDHFQEIWHSWRPDIFKKRIKITSEGEYFRPPVDARPPNAVAAFSAGVDSTFTLSRHVKRDAGRAIRNVKTAVMVHGFDMPIDADEGFETLAHHGSAICADLGVDLVTVKTNWRKIVRNWEETFGVGLVSVLHQFSKAHDVALIATEESYQNCFPVWGNSFWTDRFFTSSALKIESDGGAYDRIDRARYVGQHRSLVPHLRVCWAGPRTGDNCGVCPKCILTKLNFAAAGIAEPWPFPQGLTPELVSRMPLQTHWQKVFLELILADMESNRVADPAIIRAVADRLASAGSTESRKRPSKLKPLRGTLSKLLRASR
ncbi:hypothetical protein [Hyphomicrobium sp.]|uniref:hypothetical protein n=1 Tax=Hyphomicrobium sp. TaxID=82 RepID=UPI002D7691FF|nr:hypothetical protein [Hyphomicrobium sp.]HET6388323.1 hypothetical protein [Hyphomicrobium sp.]